MPTFGGRAEQAGIVRHGPPFACLRFSDVLGQFLLRHDDRIELSADLRQSSEQMHPLAVSQRGHSGGDDMRNVALVSVSALILGFGGSSMSGRDKP